EAALNIDFAAVAPYDPLSNSRSAILGGGYEPTCCLQMDDSSLVVFLRCDGSGTEHITSHPGRRNRKLSRSGEDHKAAKYLGWRHVATEAESGARWKDAICRL